MTSTFPTATPPPVVPDKTERTIGGGGGAILTPSVKKMEVHEVKSHFIDRKYDSEYIRCSYFYYYYYFRC